MGLRQYIKGIWNREAASLKDIKAKPLCLKWKTEADREVSINALCKYVEDEASKAIDWYHDKKKAKRAFSRFFRYSAILLTGLAGLFPVMRSIWPTAADGLWQLPIINALRPTQPELLVSFLVGVAGILVAMDRFGGFSTGWIRYVKTAQEMQNSLMEFRMDWAVRSARISYPPTPAAAADMIQCAREFLMAVQAHVIRETQAWASEFESNLAQLEKDVKTQWEEREEKARDRLEAAQPGVINLTVTNAAETDDGKFEVTLAPNQGETVKELVEGSSNWTRAAALPGLYTLTVAATISGKAAGAATAISVAPGKIRAVDLTLLKS